MTKDDFYIIRNSVTMLQLANYHRFKIIKRGSKYFTLCPFHADKNASLQIFSGYNGFHCRGCGTSGDVTKFTELYENLSPKEAGILLAERFGIEISETGMVSEEVHRKAQKAEFDRQQELLHQQQIQAELRRLGTLIYGYIRLLDEPTLPIDSKCFILGELPWMECKWEYYFSQLRK